MEAKFQKNIKGIDMVVGAKGSPLQLILSAVYQIDYPTGNIPRAEYQRLSKHPMIKQVIPLSYGDSYRGYRIIGTEPTYINQYEGVIKEGRVWQKPFEVVVGVTVAQSMRLTIGTEFFSSHGYVEVPDPNAHHGHQAYKVVGILAPSNSVLDQLVLTSMESVWKIHEKPETSAPPTEEAHTHEGDHHNHKHEDEHTHNSEAHAHDKHPHEEHTHKQPPPKPTHHQPNRPKEPIPSESITAMLVQFKSRMGILQMPRMINQNTNMQAAVPAIEVNRLLGLMGVGAEALRAIAWIIMLISGLSVFISLYNSLKARQYELALMRTMGASRQTLFIHILLESLLLSFIGFILGWLLSRAGLWVLSIMLSESYKYTFTTGGLTLDSLYVCLIALGIGFIAGLLPAFQAYRTDISKTLSHA